MPDYIYLPHGCKRDPLDYTHALEGTSDIRHVAYLGDSILRSTYCGSLYYSLHNGTVGEDCEFSDGWGEYQLSRSYHPDYLLSVKGLIRRRQIVHY